MTINNNNNNNKRRLLAAGAGLAGHNLHFLRGDEFVTVLWVLELHIAQDARPHVVTVTVDLELAFEGVSSADLCGQGDTHAAVVLL